MKARDRNIPIRLLTEPDFETAAAIFGAAFGYPGRPLREMAFLHSLQPDGRFIALCDGKPVGLVGAIDYDRIAYVGQLAVLPEHQGKGIGRVLMEHILKWLGGRGPRVTLLEATPSGARLYAALGFVVDEEICVFQSSHATRPATCPRPVAVMRSSDLEPVADFDAAIFGSNRARVLRAFLDELPGRALVARDESGAVSGYLIAQPGRLGPWEARGYNEAQVLLQAALTLDYGSEPKVVIPSSNKEGIDLLQEHGFGLERSMLHMRLGGHGSPGQRHLLYGLATPGIG